MPTDLERLGGESAVHAHVKAIMEAFFDDMIIGFQFVGRSRERIMTHESELALRHLGHRPPTRGGPSLAFMVACASTVVSFVVGSRLFRPYWQTVVCLRTSSSGGLHTIGRSSPRLWTVRTACHESVVY